MPKRYAWLDSALEYDTAGGLQSRTGIPAVVIRRAQRGKATLSPLVRSRLYNAYRADMRRDHYTALRMVSDPETGKPVATSKEARRVSSMSPDRFSRYMTMREADKRTPDEAKAASLYPEERLDKYRMLRNTGSWIVEARDLSTAPREMVEEVQRDLKDIAREIAKGNTVAMRYIMRGMSYSDRAVSDWEEYIKRRRGEQWIPLDQVEGAPGLYQVSDADGKRYKRWARRQKRKGLKGRKRKRKGRR